jgi:hypothetical protein
MVIDGGIPLSLFAREDERRGSDTPSYFRGLVVVRA